MIFTNKLLKIIKQRRSIVIFAAISAIIFSVILYKTHTNIKLNKLQINQLQEHIGIITLKKASIQRGQQSIVSDAQPIIEFYDFIASEVDY